jgi:outer membrane protein assembly factor BamD (BamD/ComL family)
MRATLKLAAFIIVIGLIFVFKPKTKLVDRLYDRAASNLADNNFKEAIDEFERLVSFSPNSEIGIVAAKKAGDLALYETKDYKKALFFFRSVTKHSQNKDDLKYAQKKIAEIYYEKLSDYNQSVVEYSRLLQQELSKDEAQKAQAKIIKSYSFAANFDQVVLESEEFERKWPDSDLLDEILILKANAKLIQKKFDDVISICDLVMKKRPDTLKEADVLLLKAQAMEEKKDLDKAIMFLDQAKGKTEHPEGIEMKIKSVKRRKEKRKE